MQQSDRFEPAHEGISILLVDDHALMREGTRRLLEEDAGLRVVGEAQDGLEAVEAVKRLQPDVVVLDIALKGMHGFEAAQAMLSVEATLKRPTILVLTAYDQPAYVHAMLRYGVKGYWLKSARASEIRQAVHDVARGRQSLAPDVRMLVEQDHETPSILLEPLTQREIEMLRLVVQGTRNHEIAQRLSISIKTVETHISSIYGKLGVQSRAEAIALTQQQGLLLEKYQA